MAKTLARITGVALRPGISRNSREYTREAIASAVTRAQQRITAGDEPLSIYTHHGAADADDTTRLVGRLTRLTVADDGSAMYEAEIADTPHGRAIVNLIDTAHGAPFLRGVSIRGAWIGEARRRTVDGRTVETGDDLELRGLDLTATPGVPGARVDTVTPVGRMRETEDGRPLIYESAGDAEVAFTDTVDAPHGAPNNTVGEKAPPTPGASHYADPGYQDDKAKRYPLDTVAHARSAWSYINMPKNAGKYTPAQLKRIKGRIRAALTKFGVKITAERWVMTPATEFVEALAVDPGGDVYPARTGCYRVEIDNGAVCIAVSSYSVDPADLEIAARAAMEGACAALAQIDPDNDGDIDTAGVDTAGESDDDAESDAAESDDDTETAPREGRESAADGGGTETPAGTAGPQDPTEKEGPGMAESTTPAAPAQAAVPAAPTADTTPAPAAPAVAESPAPAGGSDTPAAGEARFSLADIDALLGVLAKHTAIHAPVLAGVGAPAEAAPAPAAPVTETAPAAPAAAVRESEEDRVARLVREGVQKALAEHVEANGVTRKGFVESTTPTAAPDGAAFDEYPASWPRENGVPVAAHKLTAEQWKSVSRDTLPAAVLGSRG